MASKVLAERAAWEYIETNKPSYELVSILPPWTWGVRETISCALRLNTDILNRNPLFPTRNTSDRNPPVSIYSLLFPAQRLVRWRPRAISKPPSSPMSWTLLKVTSGHSLFLKPLVSALHFAEALSPGKMLVSYISNFNSA